MGHGQSWYNQEIVVDPTNPDNVLVGGNTCGARTRDGTAASPTWELVSHWLPNYEPLGSTDNGKLPYVHADWHTATVSLAGGTMRVFAGTDGGIFSSTNVFTEPVAEEVVWTHHNRGLTTHLCYSVASGDPVTLDPFVVLAGLQDNGTRFRARPSSPTVFNMTTGGDGIGTAVHVATSGTTYWASIQFGPRLYCRSSAFVDCTQAESWIYIPPLAGDPAEDDAGELAADRAYALDPHTPDSEPFYMHYANVETDAVGQSVLTHSVGQIFVSAEQPDGSLAWTPISQDLTADGYGFSNVAASRTIPGLYGAAGTDGRRPFYVTTAGNTPSTWVAAKPVSWSPIIGFVTGPSSLDFPPVQPPGTSPGQVFIGSFVGGMSNGTPVADDKGHVWRTTDGGQTWTSLAGADPAHRLPNVPVYVVKYDPVSPTTIYAGTDIGVYVSIDDGASWDRMGEGFPIIPARDLYVAKNQEFIRVATYGRGIWEIYPSATASQGTPGNGDYDRNLVIDWIDLAATASRLGVTPATTTQPFYSWLLDTAIEPNEPLPVQIIGDADLRALLAKLGGHP
jgi:hypothetical protein